jgi:hypothetical protein
MGPAPRMPMLALETSFELSGTAEKGQVSAGVPAPDPALVAGSARDGWIYRDTVAGADAGDTATDRRDFR